ncbi:hypothetical protein BDV24DRAFT_7476 [Aspergillus arachidicola]|uniref:Uncharacterized protein n=1 Tax=Aspergillus arachidicola TaxID=656916 RepID=A0A5N6XQP8_9EURO|nr:hypothetical protein BDV24DRAFT_7476 [Aspergillus arachidicola]
MFIRCGRVALERAYSIPRVELKRKLNTGDATSDADRNIGLTSGLVRDVVSFRMHWRSTLRTEKQRKEVEDRNKQVTGCSAEAPNSGPKGTQRPARAYLPSSSSCPQPVTERLPVVQHPSNNSQETCKISVLPCSLDLSMFVEDGPGPNDVYNDAISNPQIIAKTSWSRLIDRFAFHMNTEQHHDQQFICTLNSYCNRR